MQELTTALIDARQFALGDAAFRVRCKQALDETGVLVLPQFLTQDAVASIRLDGEQHRHLAFYTASIRVLLPWTGVTRCIELRPRKSTSVPAFIVSV